MIEAPMKTLYFRVGVSITLILTLDVDPPLSTLSWNLWVMSYLSLVGKPGNMDVPPEIKMLP